MLVFMFKVLHESTKTCKSSYIFSINFSVSFYPHYLIMVKGLLMENFAWVSEATSLLIGPVGSCPAHG